MADASETAQPGRELFPVFLDRRAAVGRLLDTKPWPAGDGGWALAVANDPNDRTRLGAYADWLDDVTGRATSKSAALRRLALAAPAAHLPRGWGQEHLVGGRGAGGAQYEDTRRDGVFQDGAPVEWWSARRTMTDLGYGPGESLRRPLAGGRAVCDGPGFDAGLHFVDIVTLVPGRRGQPRGVPDTLLSRFGVVVTILNGDMAKPGIARTQRYFYERTAWAEDNGSPVVPPPFLR